MKPLTPSKWELTAIIVGVCLIIGGLIIYGSSEKIQEINEEFENNTSTLENTVPNCDKAKSPLGPVWFWCPNPIIGIFIVIGVPIFIIAGILSCFAEEEDES